MLPKRLRPLKSITARELKPVRGVAFDIDDTFSSDGKITAEAFEALWKLKRKGFLLVPITGRPAGWCDHIARFWPVDAVIGENGAFAFFMAEGRLRRIETPKNIESDRAREKLSTLAQELQSRFQNLRFASDQPYREFDLAIDYCEDVVRWPEKEVAALVGLCESRGAHAKVSSIHVNTWYGDFDKQKGFKNWLEQGCPGVPASKRAVASKLESWVFIGDSPNDEPSFKFFKLSGAVANLKKFQSRIQNLPDFITKKSSGAGFCELADRLIGSPSGKKRRQ